MEIKRIIVSGTNKISDTILAIPSFYMLRRMYPHAEIIVLVKKYNYDIVKNLSYIDRIIKIDDFTKIEFLEKVSYFKTDVFIALYNDEYTSALAKASKAKIRIGPISKVNSFLTYNKGVLQKRSFSKKNEAEYNLDLIKKLNPNRFRACFEINTALGLNEKNIEVANLYFKENNLSKYERILVVNPFVGDSVKNLRDEEYISILKRVLSKYDNKLGIIITCYISDEDRVENLKKNISDKDVYIFANGDSIMNMAAIIKKANAYFGASTGATHIAGILEKKVVAIYPNKKTQNIIRWGVFNIYSAENIRYIIPDKDNKKENYKNLYFDSYHLGIEDEIVNVLIESLENKNNLNEKEENYKKNFYNE